MAWTIEFTATALREFERLDRAVQQRLRKFLLERIARSVDPRAQGAALRGTELGELWRYRVGDYRVICSIEDRKLVVLVVRVGHRREVYR